jgi:prepilin-type N-terminal cleavage/methylation domain-containing protein
LRSLRHKTFGARQATAGFTLIELLVATVVLGVVLAAASTWVWNLGALTGTTDDRVQACTIAAALARAVSDDVDSAVGMARPAAGRDPARSLAALHDPVDGAPEVVPIVWDAARRVVWRNASGTYVADHVRAFSISYVLGDGHSVAGAAMSVADWPDVRAVNIGLAVEVGSATVSRDLRVVLGLL